MTMAPGCLLRCATRSCSGACARTSRSRAQASDWRSCAISQKSMEARSAWKDRRRAACGRGFNFRKVEALDLLVRAPPVEIFPDRQSRGTILEPRLFQDRREKVGSSPGQKRCCGNAEELAHSVETEEKENRQRHRDSHHDDTDDQARAGHGRIVCARVVCGLLCSARHRGFVVNARAKILPEVVHPLHVVTRLSEWRRPVETADVPFPGVVRGDLLLLVPAEPVRALPEGLGSRPDVLRG